MKSRIVAATGMVCLLLLLLSPGSSDGASPPVAVNSKLYYKIGGAQSITAAPNPASKYKDYKITTEFGIGYSCGKFDKTLGLARLINSLNNTGNALVNGAVGAVGAAISSLPLLVLQRVSPGLYDIFQGLVIRGEAVISLANATCEDFEKEIANGQNPLERFTELSKVLDWKVQMGKNGFGLSSVDVDTAKRNVEKSNGSNGVPWICGANAAGKGQDPIRVVYDTVLAGYNITVGQPNCNQKKPSTSGGTVPPVVRVWPTPVEAAQWAVEVLGDIKIRTHEDRPTETTPGFGLLRKVAAQTPFIRTDLSNVVAGTTSVNLSVLQNIGAVGTLINADVIRVVRDLEPSDQALAVGKIAEEIAMAQVTEQAIMLRRLLETGKREPHISATPAPEYINESLETLEKEITGMLFEKRIRRELFAGTSTAILEYGAEKGITSKPSLERTQEDTKPLRGGVIPGPPP